MAEITQEIIDRYKKVTVATVYGGVRRLGYDPSFMREVKAFTPGKTIAGRARTLRFIPPRPDIMAEVHQGADSPEYVAMGSCEPGDILVCDGMGKKYAAIGGDVKLLQLKMPRPGYRGQRLRHCHIRGRPNSDGRSGRDRPL